MLRNDFIIFTRNRYKELLPDFIFHYHRARRLYLLVSGFDRSCDDAQKICLQTFFRAFYFAGQKKSKADY
jgi:hypothetical protein